MRYEEAILTQAFPEDYADYRRRVGALLPWTTNPDSRIANPETTG
jgi:protein-S-isoprenylcysteine O-methyltransferase Ste14